MHNIPITIERTLQAPVEKVWEAISDREKMKQWYFDLDEFRPEEGFAFEFTGVGHKGEKYLHRCKVVEVIPQKKLAYSWTYDKLKGYSVVTFELLAEGESTRLKLTHEGLASFSDNGPDFAPESFKQGWTGLIGTSLPDFLAKNS